MFDDPSNNPVTAAGAGQTSAAPAWDSSFDVVSRESQVGLALLTLFCIQNTFN
jgi:hypothetical protein